MVGSATTLPVALPDSPDGRDGSPKGTQYDVDMKSASPTADQDEELYAVHVTNDDVPPNNDDDDDDLGLNDDDDDLGLAVLTSGKSVGIGIGAGIGGGERSAGRRKTNLSRISTTPSASPSKITELLKAPQVIEGLEESEGCRARRLQWITYYVQTGDLNQATKFGWDGRLFELPYPGRVLSPKPRPDMPSGGDASAEDAALHFV